MGLVEPLTFALAALALLAAPGPTNTLLVTSGAAVGLQRSLHLSLATLGYLVGTIAMALVVGPIANASYIADIVMRIACGCYLLYAAWRLWRDGEATTPSDEPVPFQRVLIATSLNPKAIGFAFVIVPFLAPLRVQAVWPYLVALGVMAVAVGAGWIAVGAMIRAGARNSLAGGAVQKMGAAVLAAFALLIVGSVFTT